MTIKYYEVYVVPRLSLARYLRRLAKKKSLSARRALACNTSGFEKSVTAISVN